MAEQPGPEQGHQFHFTVQLQASVAVVDGPHTDLPAPLPGAEPFTVTVRAWNLRDACRAAAELALNDWAHGDDQLPSTYDLLNAAAERAYQAMHDCELAAGGIERDLWQKVVLAVLADPSLLPAWARGARADADTWRRACSDLDAELEEWRAEAARGLGNGWPLLRVRQALGTPDGRAVSAHAAEVRAERDQQQARIDAALAALDETSGRWTMPSPEQLVDAHNDVVKRVRAALQGDQPSEPEVPRG